jgi:peptidoglycan hydrolase-like protein with peptidoglycan-binding domain
MNKKIIKLTESDLINIVKKVLNEQSPSADLYIDRIANQKLAQSRLSSTTAKKIAPENINPKNLKFGDRGDDVKILQQKLFDKGFLKTSSMKPTGYFGELTKVALDKALGKLTPKPVTPKKSDDNKKTNTTIKDTKNNRCIAISKEECDKISSTKETEISTGSDTRCSAYMVKCLSQYNSELYGANAWNVFNTVKGNGQVKYNVYTDGSINWNNIYSQIKQNKIGKNICNEYAKSDDADKIVKSNLPKIITNSVPESTKINPSSLELGDIVGLYHKNSSNKGMAFCQRALTRNLDNNGNMEKDPFTFNSHVGFVGAIKDGIPIIIHNVSGTHTATPATKMLNKNNKDMIVWVVSDNEVKSAISNTNVKDKKSSNSGWNFFN